MLVWRAGYTFGLDPWVNCSGKGGVLYNTYLLARKIGQTLPSAGTLHPTVVHIQVKTFPFELAMLLVQYRLESIFKGGFERLQATTLGQAEEGLYSLGLNW